MVDLATAKQIDTPAFGKAMAAARGRGGVTFITSSAPRKTLEVASNDMALNYYLRFSKFHCVKKGTDAITGPNNEIYWGYASALDNSPLSECTMTRAYGSIDNGTTVDTQSDGYQMGCGSTRKSGRYVSC